MKETFLDLFQKDDIKRCITEIVKPVVNIVYNEIYPYLWFICLYNVILIFISLANLILLSRLYKKTPK